ncbi:hypothetical protein SGLAM104S_07094 [Streptomyces glaucescens]
MSMCDTSDASPVTTRPLPPFPFADSSDPAGTNSRASAGGSHSCGRWDELFGLTPAARLFPQRGPAVDRLGASIGYWRLSSACAGPAGVLPASGSGGTAVRPPLPHPTQTSMSEQPAPADTARPQRPSQPPTPYAHTPPAPGPAPTSSPASWKTPRRRGSSKGVRSAVLVRPAQRRRSPEGRSRTARQTMHSADQAVNCAKQLDACSPELRSPGLQRSGFGPGCVASVWSSAWVSRSCCPSSRRSWI